MSALKLNNHSTYRNHRMWLLSTFVFYLSIIGIVQSTVDYLQHPVKSCHVGDTVENECNKCLCTSKTVFECTSLDCKSRTTHNEIEEIAPLCFPNQLYVKNLITCICTKDGRWPHKSCHDTFQSLPPRNVITHKCKPDTYIPIDCNVCRCGPNGEILNDRCTRNACDDDVHRRNNIVTSTVFSKCEEKYWYSLAPCQFCFCVKQNRLVCNTGNYYTKNLDLGSYKLNICGKDLIKEAIELIPDSLRMLRMGLDLNKTAMTVRPIQKKVSGGLSTNNYKAIELLQENNDRKPKTQKIKLGNIGGSNEYYSDDSEAKPQKQKKKQSTSKHTLASTITTTKRSTIGVPITQIPNQDDDETADVSEGKIKEDLDVKTKKELDVKTKEDDDIKNKEDDYIKNKEDDDIKIKEDDDIETKEDDDIKSKEDDDDESKGIEVEFEQSPTTKETRARFGEKNIKEVNYQYDGNTLKINVPKVLNKVFQLALRKSMVSLSKRTQCTPGATTVHDCNMCFCLKNSKLLCTNHKCNGKKKA